ncbi:fatty acid desaturase family protein [Mangrovihabitans endophyticus]|nr:acyl-CoA desaturase [Mangrovihabitans endophyticus]
MTITLQPPAPAAGSDFAELNRRVKARGLMRRTPFHYAVRVSAILVTTAAAWAAVATLGASWWTLPVAALMAVTSAQSALIAHDVAHRQVFRSARRSERAGLIAGNLAIGMSYGWWLDKHTRHHNNPNHDDLDPDVAPEVLVWTPEAAANQHGLRRLIARHQAPLFFPMLTLLAVSLRRSSIRALRDGTVRRPALEGAVMAVHAVAYLGALLTLLPLPLALAFIVVHQGLFGIYLGLTFAPNHKGMPHPTGAEDFLRKQVLTSRNVRGGWLTDAALGGLNYQIEHHLFPAMPAPHLRTAQPIVRDYCAEIGVRYEMTSLTDSYRQALRHLHDVGAPLRDGR